MQGNTAFVIPNAITIRTRTAKYTLASFLHRDKCYRCMMSLWRHRRPANETTDAPEAANITDLSDASAVPAEDVTKFQLGNVDASSTPNKEPPDHSMYGSSVEADDEAADWASDGRLGSRASSTSVSLSTTTGGRSSAASVNTAPVETLHGDADSGQAGRAVSNYSGATSRERPSDASAAANSGLDKGSNRAGPTSKSSSTSGPDSSVDFGAESQCDTHAGVVLHESIIPCKVATLYNIFFGKTPRFFTVMCTKMGGTAVVYKPWGTPNRGNHAERKMEYTLALNYSIGPKSAKTYETHRRISMDSGVKYVTETDCRTPEVPYGQNFFTRHYFYMTAHGLNEAYLKVSAEVVYVKPCWSMTRAFIEKFVFDGVRSYWKQAPFTMLELVEAETVDATSMASIGSSGLAEPGLAPKLRRSVSIESLQSIVSATQTKQSEEAMVEALSRSRLWLICAGLLVVLLLNNIVLHYWFNGLQAQMAEMTTALNELKLASEQASRADSYCTGSDASL